MRLWAGSSLVHLMAKLLPKPMLTDCQWVVRKCQSLIQVSIYNHELFRSVVVTCIIVVYTFLFKLNCDHTLNELVATWRTIFDNAHTTICLPHVTDNTYLTHIYGCLLYAISRWVNSPTGESHSTDKRNRFGNGGIVRYAAPMMQVTNIHKALDLGCDGMHQYQSDIWIPKQNCQYSSNSIL